MTTPFLQPDLPPLDRMQRWLQTVITHPRGIEAGISSPAARAVFDVPVTAIEGLITRSRVMSSVERLAVYGNAYFARLLECLREFFPAVAELMGEELFDEIALGYLVAHPPTSYTLNHLANHFVGYLEASSAKEPPAHGEPDVTRLVIDLARLEWNIDQVFDGPGNEHQPPLALHELQKIDSAHWPDAQLEPAECLRLLEFSFPVSEYYTAFRAGQTPELPSPRPTFLALSRREYVVRRHELSRVQFELLSHLISGKTISLAIEQAAAAAAGQGMAPEQLAADLERWFRDWTAAGFFRRIWVD